MRPRLPFNLVVLVLAIGVFAVVPARAGALQLGLEDAGFNDPIGSPSAQIAFGALSAIHGKTARVLVPWGRVAPTGTAAPAGFDPANPADPHYDWTAIDSAVRDLASGGDHVLLDITGPPSPDWATPRGEPSADQVYPGSWDPSAAQFGLFAKAVASRYSGRFADPLNPGRTLPRVSMYEIWNEQNLPQFLMAPDLVGEYRALLNSAYGAIKNVSSSNLVATGGFAPVSYENISVSPLAFAAQLLCLRRTGTRLVRSVSCPVRAHLDVLAMHPYSLLATPTKHAYHYDDVLVGDMSKVSALLQAAHQLHTALPNEKYKIWVTEWAWFTDPPNTAVGDSPQVAARYTAYSVYEMWRAGVSLVIWFTARDPADINGIPINDYGLSLYYSSGKPKLTLSAFSFPVIASISRGSGLVWGRAPVSGRTRVTIQHELRRRWETIGTALSGTDGVFQFRFSASRNGVYRATLRNGSQSLAYSSVPIPAVRTHA